MKLPKFLLTAIAVLFLSCAFAQTEKQRVAEYIEQYKNIAMAEMLRTGIPASIKLAQGILETGGGQSDLASIGNNHFGIKCKTEWTGDRMFHDDDSKGECFRKYVSAEDSYRDHSDFLKTRPYYAFLFKLDPTDYEGWAKGLKKAGYATNPQYPQRLLKIIMENNLQQYTLLALQNHKRTEDELFVVKKDEEPVKEIITQVQSVVAQTISTEVEDEIQATDPAYPLNTVFNINEAKVIYATAGTSLFAVANNYNLSYKKLLEFNDLDEIDIITTSQLIYIQKKLKKGSRDVHVVMENESLHDIAQKEGMQLASVLEYNRLHKNMQPAIGERLYLKAQAPTSPKLVSNTYITTAATMR